MLAVRTKKIVTAVVICVFSAAIITGSILAGLYYGLDPYRGTVANANALSRPIDSVLTREEALGDLDFLYKIIKTRHFSARKGVTKAFQDEFDRQKAAIGGSVTMIEFLAVCRRILAALKDAHSMVAQNNGGGAGFHVHNNKFKVTDDGEIFIIVGGVSRKLTAIEGLPAADIINTVKLHTSYENDYYLYESLESKLNSGTSEALGAVGLPYKTDTLTFTYADGAGGSADLTAVLAEYDAEEETSGETQKTQPAFVRYDIDRESSLGVLTLDSCIADNLYLQTLRAFFTEVKANGIRTVAVDLSDNQGGNSRVVDEFLRYIDVPEYRHYDFFVRRGFFIGKYTNNVIRNDVIKDLAFDGAVYVITSRRTFSAATNFVTVLYDNKLCKVVGRPTGNSPTAYNDVLVFQMPNSKLYLQTTYKYSVRPDSGNKETTVPPDHYSENPLDTVKALLEQPKIRD